ncbi:MAG: saccharopine dehydrogenase [Micromonosporaceae bacterium]|nr:saccharopine dehydrogenase [Micromonosporaceae bacterium]
MPEDRSYDVVLFGATGFTGGLTAEYLARNAPAECRWALAGRNQSKLSTLRDRLAGINPACAGLPLLHADAGDPESLRAVAADARVVATTVGPYLEYGEPLVAACAEAGTDYLDLTGEPMFVNLMYLRHHATARERGARLIHCCGMDSIPYDLGVLFTVQHLPEGVPLTVEGFVRAGGTFSGGTYQSAIGIMSQMREAGRVAKERRAAEPRPAGRKVGSVKRGLHFEPAVKRWALPLPTIDPQVVRHSAAALDRYGPEFRYGHYAALRLPAALGLAGGAGALLAATQVPPLLSLLRARGRQSGEGPSAEQRAKSWFSVRFVGSGGGSRVVTKVSGGDPGYDETAKMLAESALCLAFDPGLPETSGQVTTAVAMGDALIGRLQKAGIAFAVQEP